MHMDVEDLDMPEYESDVEETSAESLLEEIDAGREVTILDTRMKNDFEEWQIEGDSVESINVPYFEFLDEEIADDVLKQVPDDRELTVVCAKGGASEYVAGALADRGYDVRHLKDGMNGWASNYEAVEVEGYDGGGSVIQYQRPSTGCLGYMVVDDGEAAVIDPLRAFTDRYIEEAEDRGASLKYAIDTHVHADHVSGVRMLSDRGVEGVIPEQSVQRGVTYADDVTTVEDGDVLEVGEVEIEVVYTPGHTSGMTSYLVDDAFLATGDGLFVESVARPDLEEGDEGAPEAAQQLYETLQNKVLTLPHDIVVGGGHYSDAAEPTEDGTYTATIGDLVDEMDALSMDEDDFVDLILSDMPPRPANYEDIIPTNLGQQVADDEEAFEMELGPNNCAASQESLAGD